MKIYTKTGDAGQTGLFAGPRVWKDDPRIEAYGSVDELNAALGLVRCVASPDAISAVIERAQHELFAVGAELATPDPQAHGTKLIGAEQVERLEQAIDAFEARLEPLRQFILPGGTELAARIHLARSICRRAERHVITLARSEADARLESIICYLNRLSDLLFVLARAANAEAGQADVVWRKEE